MKQKRNKKASAVRGSGVDAGLIREIASSPAGQGKRKKNPRSSVVPPGGPASSPGAGAAAQRTQGQRPRPGGDRGTRPYAIRLSREERAARSGAWREKEAAKLPFPKLQLRFRTFFSDIRGFFSQLWLFVKGKRLQLSLDRDTLLRGLIVGGLLVFFAIMETTFGSRFPLFGATADLMLSFVIAVAMAEGERWGAVTGLIAGLVIDALGSAGASVSALLYMPLGYAVGVLTENYFTRSAAVRAIFLLGAGVAKMFLTGCMILFGDAEIPLGGAIFDILLPEYGATVILGAIPQLLVHLCLRSFHKTRAERVY